MFMSTVTMLSATMLGRTISVGNKIYRLQKPLGSGATAVVFRGEEVLGREVEDGPKQVAIKLTIDKAAAEKERDNLLALNDAQKAADAHFFPNLIFPASKWDRLEYKFYVGRDVAGGTSDGRVSAYVLVQELVSGKGVHDMLLDFSNLSLPEPLALEIARQYARMLSLAHKANITSWDRKLGDLRWQWRIDTHSSKEDILKAWQQGDIGDLMVIDWNVTHEASEDAIAKDVFRFGLLWHRMLLGVEPKFQQGKTWQLLEPLESHAAWKGLSTGVQRILNKLLHPDPEKRYSQARDLERDIEKIVRGWKAKPEELAGDVGSAYPVDKKPPREKIFDALALVHILTLRRDDYGEKGVGIVKVDSVDTSVDTIYTALNRALRPYADAKLNRFIDKGDWDSASRRIDSLFRGVTKPAEKLLASRMRFIIQKAKISQWENNQFVRTLIEYSNAIFDYDTSDKADREKMLAVENWKKALPPYQTGDNWIAVRDAFVAAARYRLDIRAGMNAYAKADYENAKKHLVNAISRRKSISVIGKDHLKLLDMLLGDPDPLLVVIGKKLEKEKDRADLVQKGLDIFLTGANVESEAKNGKNLDTPHEALRTYLRQHPQDIVIARLLHLLDVHRPYADVQSSSTDLARRMIILEQSQRAWKLFKSAAGGDQELDLERNLEKIDNWFEEEWQSIARTIIGQLKMRSEQAESMDNDTDDAETQGWRNGILCLIYIDIRSNDEEFRKKVEEYLQNLDQQFSKLKTKLESESDAFDQKVADRLLAIAALGDSFARAYGDEVRWEHSPERTSELIDKKKVDVFNKSHLRSIFETLLLSFNTFAKK